jgi:hypothetical protein
MFQDILNFGKKFNKEREKHNKKVIYFECHKQEHTIHSCFLLFSHLKGTDGTSRQDQKDKSSKNGFKRKRKAKIMNAIWNIDSDNDNNDSDNKASHSQEVNFVLIAMVEDISSGVDVETIIISKNFTDPITIELLRKIAESKNFKTQLSTMMCAQPTVSTSLKQPSLSSHEEVIKVASPTPTLEVVKDPMAHSFMTPSSIEPMMLRCNLHSM